MSASPFSAFRARYFHFLGEALEAVPEERRRLGLLVAAAALVHFLLFLGVRIAAPPEASLQGAAFPVRHVLMIAPAEAAPSATRGDPGFWSRIGDPSLVIYPPDFLSLAGTHPALAQPIWAEEAPGGTTTVALPPALQFLPDRLPPLPERARADLAASSPAALSFRFSLHPVPFLPAAGKTRVAWGESWPPARRRTGTSLPPRAGSWPNRG